MIKFAITFRVAVAVALSAAAALACAQSDYPNRSVHVIVGYPPGGGNDNIARTFSQPLAAALAQPVVVENRPGAAGNIAAEHVARAKDPYRLLFVGGAHVINASLYSRLPYDPIKDFSPISLIATSPNIFVAHPSLKVKNLQELIALAKTKPGQISYASPGNGTPMHLAMELFASTAGIKLLHVPYAGVASITAVLAGTTDLLTMSVPSVLPHIQSGKLIPLGVTSKVRSSVVPSVPTVAEAAGLPEYEALAWFGMLAPANMPPGAIARLNATIVQAASQPGIRSTLQAQGFAPATNTPEEFREFLLRDMDKWSKVVKASGAKID